jgi:hypothetical protein
MIEKILTETILPPTMTIRDRTSGMGANWGMTHKHAAKNTAAA